jgi:hypothetical protein
MKKMMFPLLLPVLASTLFASGVPVQDMSSSTLAIEYLGTAAGQTITKAEVASLMRGHFLICRYAPIPYLLISAGLGGTRFSTAEYDSARFTGSTGVSAALGVHGYSPRFLEILMGTAGLETYMVNSSRDEYRYIAALVVPRGGLRLMAGKILDIELGGKVHLLTGLMKEPDSDSNNRFSNVNYARGYAAVTLHSINSSAYATFSFDASPRILDADWSEGPYESSFSLQVGFLLRQKRGAPPAARHSEEKSGKGEMERQRDTMMEEIQDD